MSFPNEYFEGCSRADISRLAVIQLASRMRELGKDITFGAYAKGMLNAMQHAPEEVKAVGKPIMESYISRIWVDNWSGYSYMSPEQILESEAEFKEELFNTIVGYIFDHRLQETPWAMDIKRHVSTAPWEMSLS